MIIVKAIADGNLTRRTGFLHFRDAYQGSKFFVPYLGAISICLSG